MKFFAIAALAAAASATMLEDTFEVEELKGKKDGCMVKKFIWKKCHAAKNKKRCAARVFKGMMRVPCFKAIATKCKKDKKCWMAAKPALMKCKAATMKKMAMMKKKFLSKPCGQKLAKMCGKNKACWKKNGAAVKKCWMSKEELVELKGKKGCPIRKAMMKCKKAKNPKMCMRKVKMMV